VQARNSISGDASTGADAARRLKMYVALIAKSVYYSIPVMIFFLSINLLPKVISNVSAGLPILSGALGLMVVSLKLWALALSPLLAIVSLIFWSSFRKGGASQ
jgi:hypothetical protein